MPNVAGGGTYFNNPNILGMLFLIGQNMTPFLNQIGGLGRVKVARSWEFAISSEYALESAAQPAITEDASKTAPTATTYVPAQIKNVCQIFHKTIDLTYANQSDTTTLTGLALAGQTPAVSNKMSFQEAAAMRQLSVDLEFTFLNGSYNLALASNQANKTRGIISAITTNTVAAGGAALTKDMIDEAMRALANSGAPMGNLALHANAWQCDKLSDLYGYAPMDRNVGGVRIETILTSFGKLSVVYSPKMPTTTLGIFDVNAVSPVVLPTVNKSGDAGYIVIEPLAKTGAADQEQLYAQMGLDHGPESFHATITGLADA